MDPLCKFVTASEYFDLQLFDPVPVQFNTRIFLVMGALHL